MSNTISNTTSNYFYTIQSFLKTYLDININTKNSTGSINSDTNNQILNETFGIPFAKKRKTSFASRKTYLQKAIYKKLVHLHGISNIIAQEYINKLEHEYILTIRVHNTVVQNTIVQNTQQVNSNNFNWIKPFFIAYLEIIHKQLNQENPLLKHLINSKNHNNIETTFNINLNKNTLYSTELLESKQNVYEFLHKNPQQISKSFALQSLLITFPVILLQHTNYTHYCQKENTEYQIKECSNKPKTTLPLFLIDNHLLAYYTALYITETQDSYLNTIPVFYKKHIKSFFRQRATVQHLAKHIKSTKKAKRILRIMHKRLRIYTHKKPKWLLP